MLFPCFIVSLIKGTLVGNDNNFINMLVKIIRVSVTDFAFRLSKESKQFQNNLKYS